jgi:four helix bundle protein
MRYERFEDLPVWVAAIELGVGVYSLTGSGCLKEHDGLRDQLERAVISISNNIAEGYERGTHDEVLTFLYYAKGSAGELRSMLAFMGKCPEWERSWGQVDQLRLQSLDVGRQLGGWLESLKNSSSPGPRYQNSQTYRAKDAVKRRDAYLDYLRRVQSEAAQRTPDPPPEE